MASRKWTRILATTDFSPFASRAVSYAHELAEQLGAELHVLHVARSIHELAVEHGTSGRLGPSSTEADGGEWLADLLGETRSIERIEAVRVGQDIAQTIIHYAQQNEIDVIVIATHGRTGLPHAVLGSIAEKVMRSSPCPLLALPPTFGT